MGWSQLTARGEAEQGLLQRRATARPSSEDDQWEKAAGTAVRDVSLPFGITATFIWCASP